MRAHVGANSHVCVWLSQGKTGLSKSMAANGWANYVRLPLETIRYVKLSLLSFTRMDAALLSMEGANGVTHGRPTTYQHRIILCTETQYQGVTPPPPHHHTFPHLLLIHTSARTHARAHARAHARTHTHTTNTPTHRHTYTRTHASTHTRTHTHTQMTHACMHACMHARTIQRAHYCTCVGSTSARTHAHSRACLDK